MNKLWDDLKDNMKEWGASAVEKAEEISRVAVAKGEEFTKISKLKFDILQLQKNKSKIYESLGKLVYQKTHNNNMSNFTGNTEFFNFIEVIPLRIISNYSTHIFIVIKRIDIINQFIKMFFITIST